MRNLPYRALVVSMLATWLAGCGPSDTTTTDAVPETVPVVAKMPAQLPHRAWFGELHVHSSNSPDAFMLGVRTSPEDAYRYARGEAIDHISGVKIRASAALDFMAVTDHAEYLGLLPLLTRPDGPLANTTLAREILSGDRKRFGAAAQKILYTLGANPPKPLPELVVPEISVPLWHDYVTLAERYNEPGVFTALVAYEWTSIPDAQNLHRNVIFRGTQVPELPFSAFDSDKPEDLWRWLDRARASGSDVLAIPHNSNLSDGRMFELQDSQGKALTAQYAAMRMRNEPLVEVTQIKGTSETHPILSPGDEWAGFEIMEELLGGEQGNGEIQGSYARQAYLNGLELQAGQGFNPYRFGLVGASDSHNSSVPVEEDNYTGKIGSADGTAEARRGGSFISSSNFDYSASGLAGVWAAENTREQIFDALKRKEVFATSGPRIAVRLFAGNFGDDPANGGLETEDLYARGVPMGSEITGATQAPRLYAWAARDPRSAPLQRLQIIKGWIENGKQREQVIDVACSGGAQPDAKSQRCPDSGVTVDTATCIIDERSGSTQLAAVWVDPDFDATMPAIYYLRALESPSCRWSTWDALRNGWELAEGVAATIQERAWSSPIWFTP
jgi:hypothetical protein